MKIPQKAMIATLYSYEPVIRGAIKVGVEDLFLVVDHHPDKEQSNAINEVKKALSSYVNIQIIHTDVYDISNVALDCIQIIDTIHDKKIIYLNVSGARKTKSMGLMFAGYARNQKIHQIMYVTKEKGELIILPILSFNMNKSEIEVLQTLSKNKHASKMPAKYQVNISRSQFYKALANLKSKGFIDEDSKITDAGRIALM
ncbi:MAG: CRISPR-associated CARF protein Csa3 [Nanoarchaeota archaeon]